MLTLPEIVASLQDRRPAMVAKGTGLTRPTIAFIRDGKNTNPSYDTLQKLSDYLEKK